MRYAEEKPTFANRGYRLLHLTQRMLITAGALMLCYVAATLLYAEYYQKVANNTLDRQMRFEPRHAAIVLRPAVKEGEVLGRIVIPRLGVRVAILEGTSARTLRLGVGHIDGTAFPGQPGDIGIAGHRDTFFRALKDIHRNDVISIDTAAGVTRYAVDWIAITTRSDGGILTGSKGPSLTLVTCYPFYYIGAAPERYVVHAHRL